MTTNSNPLRWFPELLELGRRRFRAQSRLLGSAVVVGALAGLAAIAFSIACQFVAYGALDVLAGYHADGPAGERGVEVLLAVDRTLRPWALLLLPVVGGLLSGWLVFRFAPEAEGHGTDAVIAAYHHRQGYIRARVPIVKLLASALTIGTGGSGGREGPIAQIGAGVGSFLGRSLRLTAAERRILVAAGMGAGVAAIFRAPLAGALFAAEVLYGSPEFEAEVIIPAGIASAVSYCTFGAVFGWRPLFDMPALTFTNPWQLGLYSLLALFMVVLAMLYTRTFYGCTAFFRGLPMPKYLKPALGAGLSGLVGVGLYFLLNRNSQVLSVMSFGYGVLQESMTHDDGLSALVLLAIALGKIATTSLTIGSGGSGGVFGPSMVIGGCGGGAMGYLVHGLWPELVPHPASFVVVGMAGFFAAAAKTPFSTLVIVSEMTGGYHLFLPALWVCAWSFLLSDQQSIYSSQVESRSRSPAHQGSYVRDVLAGLRVQQFLGDRLQTPVLRPGDSLEGVIDKLSNATHSVLPVVDDGQRLLGVVNLEEVHLATQLPNSRALLLAEDLMRTDISPLRPEHGLDKAVELFVQNDLPSLPVVDTAADRRVVGVVRRAEIAAAYLQHVHGPVAGPQGGEPR